MVLYENASGSSVLWIVDATYKYLLSFTKVWTHISTLCKRDCEEIMTKNHYPEYKKDSFVCPHCKAYTGHKFRDLYLYEGEMFSGYDQFPPFELLTIEYPAPLDGNAETQTGEFAVQAEDMNWHVSICYSCKKSSFWEGTKLVYPMPADVGFPEPSAEMPEGVLELYKEASAVFSVSKRASAALMRAAAEKLVYELTKDNLPPEAKLDGRIKFLSRSVSQDVFKALTIIRTVGNKVLHSKDEEVLAVTIFLNEDAEGIPGILANSLNALVNEFIINRKLINEMYDRLPNSIRNNLDSYLKEDKDVNSMDANRENKEGDSRG